jgi:hypothetical protein
MAFPAGQRHKSVLPETSNDAKTAHVVTITCADERGCLRADACRRGEGSSEARWVGRGGRWWEVVGGGGRWWEVVGGGGRWWEVVGGGGRWWEVVGGGGGRTATVVPRLVSNPTACVPKGLSHETILILVICYKC